MKKRLFAMILCFLIGLSGCDLAQVEAGLDAAEEKAERKVEAAAREIAEEVLPPVKTEEDNPKQPKTAKETPAEPGKQEAQVQRLSREDAETIALEHAKLNREQMKYLRSEYDRDDGVPEYEVSFHHDRFEYEYEIHAETGAIRSFEKDT